MDIAEHILSAHFMPPCHVPTRDGFWLHNDVHACAADYLSDTLVIAQ